MNRSKADHVPAATSPEQLQIVDAAGGASSSSSMSAAEHKETYVNMLYNPSASSSLPSSAVPIESPIEEDDDVEMVKNQTRKSSRGPFRFKQLNLMKSGSYKLKNVSPPPLHLHESPPALGELERQKSITTGSSTSRASRLKKFFMLSQANPSRKRQKDISLKNLRHVL